MIVSLLGEYLDIRGFFEHPLRLGDNLFTDRCNGNFVAGALEQRNIKFLLQFADRDAQGRLTDKAGFGGPPKMAGASKGNDVAEFGESHD